MSRTESLFSSFRNKGGWDDCAFIQYDDANDAKVLVDSSERWALSGWRVRYAVSSIQRSHPFAPGPAAASSSSSSSSKVSKDMMREGKFAERRKIETGLVGMGDKGNKSEEHGNDDGNDEPTPRPRRGAYLENANNSGRVILRESFRERHSERVISSCITMLQVALASLA